MPTRNIITNQGLELLASSSTFAGQSYWISHYALAYVPNFWKQSTGNLDIPVTNGQGDGGDITGDGHPIGTGTPNEGPFDIVPTDNDVLNTSMTRLTKFGDMIWNIFQGDLTGSGFIDGLSDGSAGGDLFGLTMYSANIKKHYRYVIDGNGNNNLLAWQVDSTDVTKMVEAQRYYGTDGFTSSSMPIPAPLYYFGDVSKDNNPGPFDTSLYLGDFLNNTGADKYPSISVNVVTFPFIGLHEIPKISIDYRGYKNFVSALSGPITPNINFEDGQLASEVLPVSLGDVNAWYESATTITSSFNSSLLSIVSAPGYLNRFHQLLTVSNYNRYHSPVSADGNILNSDLKNRNMAKVSKLFPISDYSVLNSQHGITSTGEKREVATGLTISIDLNLRPLAKTSGYTGNTYSETSDLTLQDRYKNPNNTDPLFNKTTTSFKFNRMGIYAIPLRKAPSSTVPVVPGQNIKPEMEIDPDAEPVLFAVVDWDNTVVLSDSGDGAHQFKAQINVNLESPDGVNDTPLVRDTAIFFNLYNESSINWYKNQLLANASTQHAVIELQQQVNSLRERSIRSFTPSPQVVQNNQTSVNGIINISDSSTKSDGGLHGINSFAENTILPETSALYKLGLNSVTLGNGTASEHDNSLVTGFNNHIIRNGDSSAIIGGMNNIIKISASKSVILGGETNIIWDGAFNSGILAATTSQIHDDNTNAVILGGLDNHIHADQSVILGGEGLSTGATNQVVIGKFNDYAGSDNNSHLIIGDGIAGFPSNAFEFITKTALAIAGQRTINIKNLVTNTDVALLNSGDIYIDGSSYDGDGYILRIKA